MKKIFFTGMTAVLLGGAFTSCSHDLDVDRSAMEQSIKATYEQAFVSRFGTPAPNQDWGFGSSQSLARTRGVVASPSVSDAGLTFNAMLTEQGSKIWASLNSFPSSELSQFNQFKTWDGKGWTDRYYQINASVVYSNLSEDYYAQMRNVLLKQIPEEENNLDKAIQTGYTITTKGGPVTLTPIYHQSSSGDKISYYYYNPADYASTNGVPTVEQVKAMKKYTIGNMADPDACAADNLSFKKQTFSLVYENAGSVSYDFPAGYVINFMIANTDNRNGSVNIFDRAEGGHAVTRSIALQPEYYGDSRLNAEIHTPEGTLETNPLRMYAVPNAVGLHTEITSIETPHVAVFQIGDKNYVGFEDWTDFDFNDVIFEVTGTEGGEELPDEDAFEEIRVICEDLSVGQSTDFDFNDVVFDVRRYTQDTKSNHRKDEVEIIFRAAGGTLPLYVDGHEVHDVFGVGQKTMVNTKAKAKGLNGEDNAPSRTFPVTMENVANMTIGEIANAIPVYVVKNGVDCYLEAPVGGIASKIGVKCNYVWCDEREDLDHRYSLADGTSLFRNWVQGVAPADGWYNYAKQEIDAYKAALQNQNP